MNEQSRTARLVNASVRMNYANVEKKNAPPREGKWLNLTVCNTFVQFRQFRESVGRCFIIALLPCQNRQASLLEGC